MIPVQSHFTIYISMSMVNHPELIIYAAVEANFSFRNATDLINDSNDRKNSTIFEGESVVVNCPISSVPHGNYSWNFNNNELNFDSGSRSRDAR